MVECRKRHWFVVLWSDQFGTCNFEICYFEIMIATRHYFGYIGWTSLVMILFVEFATHETDEQYKKSIYFHMGYFSLHLDSQMSQSALSSISVHSVFHLLCPHPPITVLHCNIGW